MPIQDVSHQFELSVQAQDPGYGHAMIQKEITRRWPGKKVSIVSEGLSGTLFSSVVSVPDDNSVPPSQNTLQTQVEENTHDNGTQSEDVASDGIKTPSSIIVFEGDDNGFGSISTPPEPGKPIIVLTRGDSMDHHLMDSKWKDAISGTGLLWNQQLAIKYRTGTIALYNPQKNQLIIEQGEISVACDTVTGDIRKDIQECLD